MINKKIDEFKEEIIKTTIELVKVKTIAKKTEGEYPYGKEVANLLKDTLEKCENLGFKTKNIDNYVGYAEFGEGEDYVVALGHLDVVPEGKGWSVEPYSGEIKDGYIYGRGTADDKGPVVAALYGAKAIMDLNLKLSKRVRIVFGTAEEIGGDDIEHYLKYEKPPVAGFTPDAEFPIINGEKGIINFNLAKNIKEQDGEIVLDYLKAGVAANVVPNFAECRLTGRALDKAINEVEEFNSENDRKISYELDGDFLIIKAKGINAHGSTPELGENAIMTLIKFLANLDLGTEVSSYIRFLDKYIGYDLNGKDLGVGLEDEVSGKLTLNVGIANFTRDCVDIKINLRYPVTKKYEDVMNVIDDRCKEHGIEILDIMHNGPLYYNPDHKLIKTLQKVYEEQTGEVATLISIGGGTYAKEMPNTVAFGPMFPGEEDCLHKPNERINIENLIKSAKIYGNTLYELAK